MDRIETLRRYTLLMKEITHPGRFAFSITGDASRMMDSPLVNDIVQIAVQHKLNRQTRHAHALLTLHCVALKRMPVLTFRGTHMQLQVNSLTRRDNMHRILLLALLATAASVCVLYPHKERNHRGE